MWVQAVQLLAGLGEDRLDANIILVSAAVSACEKGGHEELLGFTAWNARLVLLSSETLASLSSDDASAQGFDAAVVAVFEIS